MTKINTSGLREKIGFGVATVVVAGTIGLLDHAEKIGKQTTQAYNQALTSYANYHNKPVEDEATQKAFVADFLENVQTSYETKVNKGSAFEMRVRLHQSDEKMLTEMPAKTAIDLLENYKPSE